MGYIKHNASRLGYTLQTKSHKKFWNFGKSHNGNEVKTIGTPCSVILMESYHARIEGTCDVWSSKCILYCCIHVIVCNGVLYVVETRKG